MWSILNAKEVIRAQSKTNKRNGVLSNNFHCASYYFTFFPVYSRFSFQLLQPRGRKKRITLLKIDKILKLIHLIEEITQSYGVRLSWMSIIYWKSEENIAIEIYKTTVNRTKKLSSYQIKSNWVS